MINSKYDIYEDKPEKLYEIVWAGRSDDKNEDSLVISDVGNKDRAGTIEVRARDIRRLALRLEEIADAAFLEEI